MSCFWWGYRGRTSTTSNPSPFFSLSLKGVFFISGTIPCFYLLLFPLILTRQKREKFIPTLVNRYGVQQLKKEDVLCGNTKVSSLSIFHSRVRASVPTTSACLPREDWRGNGIRSILLLLALFVFSIFT